MSENPSPNDHMVGGNHYRAVDGEQHWDRMWRLYGRGYFVGCITKYVERYHLKNGLEDLQKAKHFIEKLLSLEQRKLEESKAEELYQAWRGGYISTSHETDEATIRKVYKETLANEPH